MTDRFKYKYRISSARLAGYDYGQNGAYFITICTKNRINYFGEIVETQYFASLRATAIGKIAIEYWEKIPEHFPFVLLDEFQIMPNHLHGIIIIDKCRANIGNADTHNDVETHHYASLPGKTKPSKYRNKFGPQSGNLSSVLRGYKAAVKSFATTNDIGFAWQARFHDRIIRNEDEMNRIRKYVVENPGNWFRDQNNMEGLFM